MLKTGPGNRPNFLEKASAFPSLYPIVYPMSIGFKEWTLVCNALGKGSQSLILRKGGIAEGRAGFSFKHDEFLLFPTLFHEQTRHLKLPPETPLPAPSQEITVHFLAKVLWAREFSDLSAIQRLAPFHLWTDALVEERFRYDNRLSLNIALVRVFKLSQPLTFPDSPQYGGCRSWVSLPDPESHLVPVLSDAEHLARTAQIEAALGSPPFPHDRP
jgi:hypothetical protein